MLNDLYSKDVLRHAATITRTERLHAPQASAHRVSPICGSRISIDLQMTDNIITDYAQDIHACALGQAAASIVAANIVGQTPQQLAVAAQQMRTMLQEGGPPPTGDWAEFTILEKVKEHQPRHGAVMLALEAALDAAGQITGQPIEDTSVQLTTKA